MPAAVAMPGSSSSPEWGDIDESQIPGTVKLVDLDHTETSTLHTGKQSDIILVPTPSRDANDPLNWSPARKRLHLICLIM
jgi:hypothetical protein